jgi:uncharacterized Tic20 family protein
MRSETADGRTLALISHLGMLGPGLLLPLVVRLTEGRRNAFVRHHATEALNFQITFTLALFVGFGLFVAADLTTGPAGHPYPAPLSLVVFVVMMGAFVANYVFSILGCVRAGQERWWRYPVTLRLVRGAAPRGTR